MTNLRRIALTGNIASGKSVVADAWVRLGAHIIDADVLARKAVEPGSEGLRRIVEHFGAGVLADGALDRDRLRGIVFGNEDERRVLESIVHPEVERLRQEAERRAVEDGYRIVVHVIPLLFEAGLDRRFDTIVLVDADERTRRDRIVESRGLDEAEAQAMVDAQMPTAAKRARADYIIENNAGLDELERTAERVWLDIRARTE